MPPKSYIRTTWSLLPEITRAPDESQAMQLIAFDAPVNSNSFFIGILNVLITSSDMVSKSYNERFMIDQNTLDFWKHTFVYFV